MTLAIVYCIRRSKISCLYTDVSENVFVVTAELDDEASNQSKSGSMQMQVDESLPVATSCWHRQMECKQYSRDVNNNNVPNVPNSRAATSAAREPPVELPVVSALGVDMCTCLKFGMETEATEKQTAD